MEENENIWNKKTSDLTVKDVVIVNVALPVIVLGALAGAGAAVAGISAGVNKFREFRGNRTNKLEIVK